MRSLIAFLFGFVVSSPGAVILWTNTAGGSWSVAANWRPNQVPGPDDIAEITADGTYTVRLNTNASIAGLTIGGAPGTQTFNHNGNILTLQGMCEVRSNGVYALAGGTLAGANTLVGQLTWSMGSLAADSAVAISSGSLVRITGSGSKYAYGALANAGTVAVEGSGTISLTEASRIHNLPGGVFEVRSYGGLTTPAGPRSIFHNEGAFRKTMYSGSFLFSNTTFDNDGIVEIESGTLRIGYGGRGRGTFELSASTELAFDGGYTGVSGSGFSGNGRITASGGEVVLDGDAGMSGIEWAGGALGGTNRLAGSWSWSAGGLATNSAIAISIGSVVRITGSSSKYAYGALANAGTVVVEGSGAISLTEASRIHNLTGAVFEVRSYGGLSVLGGSRALFHNEGTFRKTAYTGSFQCLNTAFDNDGIVQVEKGTLRIGYGGWGWGTFELSASTELAFDGGYTGLSGSGFSGNGRITALGGEVVLDGEVGMSGIEWAGGTLGGTNRLTGSWSWSAGGFATNSAIAISSGSLVRITGSGGKYVSGSLANAGIIKVEGAGPIYLTATSRIDNLAGAVFEMQGSGGVAVLAASWPVFHNAGVFRKTLYTGTLNLSGLNFTGDGMVEIQSGQLTLGESYASQAGDIVLAGGAIQLVPQALLATSGRLSGYGTVIASVISSGTVAPAGTNGILAIQGDYTQLLEGTIEFEVGGLGASMDHSRLQVSGHAFLNGSIGVRTAPGWVPEPGAAYPVITSLSSEGALACFNGFFLLGQNLRLAPVSAPKSLSLVVVAAPDPPGPFMSILQADRILVCWPGEFAGFELQQNAGLDPAHWLSIPGVSHRYFETNMAPRQFFRLFKPATVPADPG